MPDDHADFISFPTLGGQDFVVLGQEPSPHAMPWAHWPVATGGELRWSVGVDLSANYD